ncbi:type VII secretion target [Kutzneria sp. CA-103260]|uniref:type VII secretion target n=1 Tax=Kutzneria sp. CA-103260 TaxID=2802641 RepID=UPI001BAB039E|nr:type VII secretion target [Kutzneria sp. CA-103260]QUQ65290.1 Excreted virulence factor EspC, type VII ESX diderm [Kutzneria sp. CA-103260]
MSEGYEVVPEALRHAQQSFQDANDQFAGLVIKEMPGWQLGDADLGLLGQTAGVVRDYNEALEVVRNKVRASAEGFNAISEALNTAAKIYEAQDEKYYEQFGWLAQDTNAPYQPPK